MTRLRFSAVLAAVLTFSAAAQTVNQSADSISEPEFTDVFFRLDGVKLIPLERQAAAIHTQAHGFIVMSMKSASEFPGGRSPIRFRADQKLEFVVRSLLAASMTDPNISYCLRKLNSKKKTVSVRGTPSPVIRRRGA
jgi:hypothetical protein